MADSIFDQSLPFTIHLNTPAQICFGGMDISGYALAGIHLSRPNTYTIQIADMPRSSTDYVRSPLLDIGTGDFTVSFTINASELQYNPSPGTTGSAGGQLTLLFANSINTTNYQAASAGDGLVFSFKQWTRADGTEYFPMSIHQFHTGGTYEFREYSEALPNTTYHIVIQRINMFATLYIYDENDNLLSTRYCQDGSGNPIADTTAIQYFVPSCGRGATSGQTALEASGTMCDYALTYGLTYEDFSSYPEQPTDPNVGVSTNTISFTALSSASTTAWMRTPINFGDFHLRLKLNLTDLVPSNSPGVLGAWVNIASFTRNPLSHTQFNMSYGQNHDGISIYAQAYTTNNTPPTPNNNQYAIYIRDNSQPTSQGISSDGYMFYEEDTLTGTPIGPYPFPNTFVLDIVRSANGGDYTVQIFESDGVTPCQYYSGPSTLHIVPTVPQTTPFSYFLPITVAGNGPGYTSTGSLQYYQFL